MKQLLLVFPLAFLAGCTGGTQQIQEQASAEDSLSEIIEHGPKEVRGTAGDGTSMNVIEIVATNGDTLYITTPAQMVSGGIEAGDEVDVIYNDNGDENTGVVAINISTLTKVWNHINTLGAKQSIELCSNGDVNTWNMPAPAYDSWKLEGGKLLMHSPAVLAKEVGEHTDTFDILSLRKNELVLSLHNHEIIYTR
jgi:hypothetical protein